MAETVQTSSEVQGVSGVGERTPHWTLRLPSGSTLILVAVSS